MVDMFYPVPKYAPGCNVLEWSMFISRYKHQVKYVLPLAGLALLSLLFLLTPETAESNDLANAEELLLNISYKNKYCDRDACNMPVTIEYSALTELSYCPDNTCDVFSMPLSIDHDEFYDFVLMYLYYKSGYLYLEEIKDRYWAEHIDHISDKYSAGMSKPSDDMDIDCILKTLALKNDITVVFFRNDENVKQITPVALKKCNGK